MERPSCSRWTSVACGGQWSGHSGTVDEMVIFRIADGRIAEAWEVYDEASMWRQLGVA